MIGKHQVPMKKTALIAHSILSKLPTVELLRMFTLGLMSGKTGLTAGITMIVLKPSKSAAQSTRSSVLIAELPPSLTLSTALDGFQS